MPCDGSAAGLGLAGLGFGLGLGLEQFLSVDPGFELGVRVRVRVGVGVGIPACDERQDAGVVLRKQLLGHLRVGVRLRVRFRVLKLGLRAEGCGLGFVAVGGDRIKVRSGG